MVKKMKLIRKGLIGICSLVFVIVCVGIFTSTHTGKLSVAQIAMPRANFKAVLSETYITVMPPYKNLSLSHRQALTQTYTFLDKQFDLRLIVIVYNRANSLTRLLKSINEADYGNDLVKLEVWIDRSVDGRFDSLTFDAAESFRFEHGEYSVTVHPTHVGIYGQWLTTWKPRINSSEIAVILEDDLTVSPHFYKYLKLVHKSYDDITEINGYSLQGVSMKHFIHDTSTLEGPKDSHVFLYPVLGTWGFSPNTKNWIQFLNWFTKIYSDTNFVPIIPDNIVSSWYQQFIKVGKTEGMWSIWHIYFAWKNQEYTLYSNFKGHRGLSVNWMEPGLHYSGNDSKPSNNMLTEWSTEYEDLPDNPIHLNTAGHIIPAESSR